MDLYGVKILSSVHLDFAKCFIAAIKMAILTIFDDIFLLIYIYVLIEKALIGTTGNIQENRLITRKRKTKVRELETLDKMLENQLSPKLSEPTIYMECT